jgi:hypothetical protein
MGVVGLGRAKAELMDGLAGIPGSGLSTYS